MNDLTKFLSPESKAWYSRHGIPFKRNYMFYGPPGSGKTSIIQALSSAFDRNVCFIQPCHPEMTDDKFKAALQSTPARSVIVVEDIDSLFARDRSKQNRQCPLTFSGFLNGLDGLGAPNGQIIMMTTNHMERLDPALIRAGRVDVMLELAHASTTQIADLFLSFYPGQHAYAQQFAETLISNKISMASAQNHFIRHRLSDARTAATDVDLASLRGWHETQTAEETKNKQEEQLPAGATEKASTSVRGVTSGASEVQNYTMRCEITSGRPRTGVIYEWKRDGVTEIETGATLTITEVERSMHGSNYTCAADNGAGLGEHGEAFTFIVYCKL